MDLSALIFVALAVAWAVYLVPKALKHHEELSRSRSVERFSRSMRVLARREAVDRRTAQLVRPGQRAASVEAEVSPSAPSAPEPAAPELTPAQLRARRAAATRATKRRRNVLGLLLVANLAVVGMAAFSLVSWWYVAIPAGLLVAWLVACRVMVKGERAALRPKSKPAQRPAPVAEESPAPPVVQERAASAVEDEDGFDPMEDTSAGISAVVDPELWDPVSVPLPTYVSKPAASRRTVRTIDLEATGVWTSGRTDADARLAREADEAARAAKTAGASSRGDDGRAVGS